jgi:hypothetical protein
VIFGKAMNFRNRLDTDLTLKSNYRTSRSLKVMGHVLCNLKLITCQQLYRSPVGELALF